MLENTSRRKKGKEEKGRMYRLRCAPSLLATSLRESQCGRTAPRPAQLLRYAYLCAHHGRTSRYTASATTTSSRSNGTSARRATYSTAIPPPPSPPPPSDGDAHPLTYRPPTSGFISRLPAPLIPYAELSRLDKPAGTLYLFLPCLFSTLLAAPLALPPASAASVLGTSALFVAGAFIMRGAGCTINDLWDRNLDPLVARTRLRPLARRALTPRAALAHTAVQLAAGLAVLLQLPPACLAVAVPSLLLVAAYPLAKRVTHYPQLVLGLTFSWGALVGFPALGVPLLLPPALGAGAGGSGGVAALLASAASSPALLLYASCTAWTVLYDMIYAHMDLRDDARAGIKSIALRHAAHTKPVLAGLAAVQVALLAAAGAAAGAGPLFFAGSCGGAAATLALMIWRVRLSSASSCWWWFAKGGYFTGGAVVLGLLADYVVRVSWGG